MLSIQNLTYRIAGRTLFDDASLSVPTGHRVGLVGPNGMGKTTLFKLIMGELERDGGEITLIKGATVGMVRQDLPDDETSLVDVVLASDTERASLFKEAETAEDPDRIGYIYERLEAISAYDAPARATRILAGLGFDEDAQNSPISSFSGGWRARVALAAALFCQPNLLMLDEPTNHLDFEALVWLENYLMRYTQTLLIISHDRDFLNKTVTQIVHVENQKLVAYTGNYDQFERTRAEKMMNQKALYEKQQAQRAHMMKFVDRFRASASKARQAQSRLKAIEKMDLVDALIAERVTAFTFPEPEDLKSSLMHLEEVEVGYVPGSPVLKDLSLLIDKDDRIALLGANGNGKSTLVKLLSGRLAESTGTVFKPNKLRIGYFAQFQTDELEVDLTAFEVMREAMKGLPESKVRASLGRFGFDKNKADTRVGDLSGGEKARLLFCRMSFDAPHIMLLDEPTNHLDMDAREALIQALNSYSGAVILVSHDTHLVECVADRLWLVADGTCTPFEDDLDAYRALIVNQRRREREEARQEKTGKRAGKKAKHSKQQASSPEALVREWEAKIADISAQIEAVQNDIATCCERGHVHDMKRLNLSHDALQKELKAAEDALLAVMV